ncbi:DUF938 domain-containing protein [Ketobacter sp.]|uniref:DUF938 domain-containing protein n=1 Tax=Ketobacter sp. TaxID=2083498 RepID=UPI000F0E4C09|nr:DUF938 domain-containing protein [Ketobacter sp.]RLT93253.1 MAG: DUF938 domain-containing protein [Ketobacter sp.]
MDNKPFSQACENNKLPILEVLQRHLTTPASLLEVGSGTGQHAAFFSGQLPHIQWHPSDVADNLTGIRAWCDEAGHPNLHAPISFDVTQQNAVPGPRDHLFSANTLHIMSWPAVAAFFERVPALVKPTGYVIIYGPFKYNGEFTSDSNARFDLWLKARGAHQGIRDFEAIASLATQAGLRWVEDVRMPANNQTLVWQKAP